MFIYCKLLLACGIHPGKEINSIKWIHVDENYKNETNGLFYIRINLPHRKTEREWADDHVLVSRDFQWCLEELKKATMRTDPDDYLFCKFDGSMTKGFPHQFKAFLEESDMRLFDDDEKKSRTLCSVRHYYATSQITKTKVSREVLSRHMATSVTMLEQYYVHADTADFSEELAPSYECQTTNLNKKPIFLH